MHRLTTVSSMLAEKGFTCLQVDLSPPTDSETLSSNEITAHFESGRFGILACISKELIIGYVIGLRFAIRSAMIPFAPVIIARSAGCIIAQTYVFSNPAIGIFLVPDVSNRAVPTKLLPYTLEEFHFEVTFPIAVMGTHADMDVLKSRGRLWKENAVDLIETSELSDHAFLTKLESWLDNLGV